MIGDDLAGEADHGCSDRCRRRKWAGVRFLYNLVQQPPYRYRSIACALEAAPGRGYTISKATFVTSIMAAYRFDRKLRMDSQLGSLYECFEGSRAGEVDYRDIVSCMVVLRRFRDVRCNPRKLFLELVLMYSAEVEASVVRRQDALKVVRMGATSSGEVMQTSTRLDKYLAEQAGSRGLKPTFRDLSIPFLMDIVDDNRTVLVAFRTQLWQRIPEAWRTGVLRAVEEMGFKKANSGAVAIKERRATRWYTRNLSRRVLLAWKVFRNLMKRIKVQRAHVERFIIRQTLRRWHASASTGAVRRMRRDIAKQRGRIYKLRRFFRYIAKHVEMNKRLSAMAWNFTKKGKIVIAGVGVMRGVLRRRSMRSALWAWCETASLMNAWEFVVNLEEERLCRRMFHIMRDTVQASIAKRRAEDEMDIRAAALAESLEEAERERVRMMKAAEEQKKRQKAEQKAALMARRAAENKERIEAARAGSVARDAQIMQRQREARRRRVYEDRAKMKSEFDAIWEVKFKDSVERAMEESRQWLTSDPEASFKVQKELHVLKRRFYAAPTPETTELERSLRDPSNAIFAHMAHTLYKEDMPLSAFFNQYDTEGDGYLTHEEFKGMVSSLEIKLSGEQIRSIIRTIDLDGSGFIDFPEFVAAERRHEEVCGQAGSRWKMYVSPVHAIMIFHNVETNEEIWDYKATDQDLLRVVKDNIVGLAGIEAKQKMAREREEDWEARLMDKAATAMQRQYHARVARKKRSLVHWKWDVEKARIKNRETNLMAGKIQSWWRTLRAKWLALQLLMITVEVLWDPGEKQQYYFNHRLGQAAWEVPSMLRRWRGKDAKMPPLTEWVFISRAFGQSYYVNTRNQMRQDEKPTGYMRCSSCQIQLASRRCTVEERDLCFVCYRGEHLDGNERLWHHWEPSKALTCDICHQHDAALVCHDCAAKQPSRRKVDGQNRSGHPHHHQHDNFTGGGAGAVPSPPLGSGRAGLLLCDRCWERTHTHGEAEHHKRVTVEEWEARDRAAKKALALTSQQQHEEGTLLAEAGGVRGEMVVVEDGGQNVALAEQAGWRDDGFVVDSTIGQDGASSAIDWNGSGHGGDGYGDYDYSYDYADGGEMGYDGYAGAEHFGHEPFADAVVNQEGAGVGDNDSLRVPEQQ